MAGNNATADETQAVYERQAAAYDAKRSRALFEARWLARFTASLRNGARVLDLGCGAGEPIARWFIAEGFQVTGVDFAAPVIDRSPEPEPRAQRAFGERPGPRPTRPRSWYSWARPNMSARWMISTPSFFAAAISTFVSSMAVLTSSAVVDAAMAWPSCGSSSRPMRWSLSSTSSWWP